MGIVKRAAGPGFKKEKRTNFEWFFLRHVFDDLAYELTSSAIEPTTKRIKRIPLTEAEYNAVMRMYYGVMEPISFKSARDTPFPVFLALAVSKIRQLPGLQDTKVIRNNQDRTYSLQRHERTHENLNLPPDFSFLTAPGLIRIAHTDSEQFPAILYQIDPATGWQKNAPVAVSQNLYDVLQKLHQAGGKIVNKKQLKLDALGSNGLQQLYMLFDKAFGISSIGHTLIQDTKDGYSLAMLPFAPGHNYGENPPADFTAPMITCFTQLNSSASMQNTDVFSAQEIVAATKMPQTTDFGIFQLVDKRRNQMILNGPTGLFTLRPKAFCILDLLHKFRGRRVSRHFLQAVLFPDAGNLPFNGNLYLLRAALDEAGYPARQIIVSEKNEATREIKWFRFGDNISLPEATISQVSRRPGTTAVGQNDAQRSLKIRLA